MGITKEKLENSNLEIEESFWNSGIRFEKSISIKCDVCGNRLIRTKNRKFFLCVCGRVYCRNGRKFEEVQNHNSKYMFDYISVIEERKSRMRRD